MSDGTPVKSEKTGTPEMSDKRQPQLNIRGSVTPKQSSLKRKNLHEVDFCSEIVAICVCDETLSTEEQRKTYHIHKNVLDLALPALSMTYPKVADEYWVRDICTTDFEKILHWVVYGQLSVVGGTIEDTALAMAWGRLFRLYGTAERLSAPGLQNALIDCIIIKYNSVYKPPWNSMHTFFQDAHATKKSDCMATGLGKLCFDFLVHREGDEEGAERLNAWAKDEILPDNFFANLAMRMMNKSVLPPYEEDPSQYHVSMV